MIKLKNVVKSYNKINVIDDINLTIPEGEFVFLTGHSGAGKSTIIKILMLDEDITEGSIFVLNKNISNIPMKKRYLYRREIGVVFQDLLILKDKTVYENVELATRVVGSSEQEIKYRVFEALKKVGLLEKYKKYPEKLSGGECQRVCIARAIVNKPSIILADECSGNLDAENTMIVIDILKKLNEEGKTVIFATHDIALTKLFESRTIQLEKGRIVKDEYRYF